MSNGPCSARAGPTRRTKSAACPSSRRERRVPDTRRLLDRLPRVGRSAHRSRDDDRSQSGKNQGNDNGHGQRRPASTTKRTVDCGGFPVACNVAPLDPRVPSVITLSTPSVVCVAERWEGTDMRRVSSDRMRATSELRKNRARGAPGPWRREYGPSAVR